MAITPPPPPPNSGDPANFNARADAFLGWFPAFVSQFNADLPFISSKGWATYGGSANAITLTAGVVSLVRGVQVRFRATASNTAAATINLDGLGAIACRTITGAVLPAGYIRTDADTVATYDGTYWIVDRQLERGANANGSFYRDASGYQSCWAGLDTQNGAERSITFPATFVSATTALSVALAPVSSSLTSLSPRLTAKSDAGMDVSCFNNANARISTRVEYVATGRWY